MAGVRPAARPAATRPSKIFTFAILLLILAAFLLLFSGDDHHSQPVASSGGSAVIRRAFLSVRSDPLRSRLDLARRQAADHAALATAYASHARRLKLDAARQLHVFEDLSSSLSSLLPRLDPEAFADEDSLRSLEKEVKERIKFARQVIAESKESFDTQLKIQKLRDTIFAVNEQLLRARKLRSLSSTIAASSTPKSLHCLAMRLLDHRISHPESHPRPSRNPDLYSNPNLYHFVLISDNVIAAAVVVSSAIKNAEEPRRHVFHIVTDEMYLAAMQAWFDLRPPPGGARVEVRSIAAFPFINLSYAPVVRQIEGGQRNVQLLDHLRFYLPEMFPKLKRVIFLEDDVVVQRDLGGLWRVDLDGRVNGAVEMCFGGFRRYGRYLNFSHPAVRERFSPRACAWGYGVNVFDLDAWRREGCTEQYHEYQNLNEDGTLWNPISVLPAGLMTFYTTTKPLEKRWHVMGLGYNPSVSPEEIRNAAVVHFNGNMKPWLDVAMNQYKQLWTKYVDTDMEFLQLCNFGL